MILSCTAGSVVTRVCFPELRGATSPALSKRKTAEPWNAGSGGPLEVKFESLNLQGQH